MKLRIISIILFILLISGCSEPLPLDKLYYQGDWQNDNVRLLITKEGKVSYRKVIDGTTTTIDAPIKSFIGDNIEVGVGWFTTIFEVSAPPQQVDGLWLMTVDGYRLTKNQDQVDLNKPSPH